jgi:hypothetical protein
VETPYTQHGVTFETPVDWVNRSLAAYWAPAPPGKRKTPNLVIGGEPFRAGETLASVVARQLAGLAEHLGEFKVLGRSEISVSGLTAVHTRFSWVGHIGMVEQTMTMIERLASSGRVAIIFTSTVRAEDAEKTRALFEEMVRFVSAQR